jgi:hypothetical protein
LVKGKRFITVIGAAVGTFVALDQALYSQSRNLPWTTTAIHYFSQGYYCRDKKIYERVEELTEHGMELHSLCQPNSKIIDTARVAYYDKVLSQRKMTFELNPSLTPMYLKMGPNYLKNVPLKSLNPADYPAQPETGVSPLSSATLVESKEQDYDVEDGYLLKGNKETVTPPPSKPATLVESKEQDYDVEDGYPW